MEKNKNTGLVVTLIILVIALLGMSGFIIYDRVLKEKDDKEIIDSNGIDKNTNNENYVNDKIEDSKIVNDFTYNIVTKDIHKFLIGKYAPSDLSSTFLEIKEDGKVFLSIAECERISTYDNDDVDIRIMYNDWSNIDSYKDKGITEAIISVSPKVGSNVYFTPFDLSGKLDKDGNTLKMDDGYDFMSLSSVGCDIGQTKFKKQ